MSVAAWGRPIGQAQAEPDMTSDDRVAAVAAEVERQANSTAEEARRSNDVKGFRGEGETTLIGLLLLDLQVVSDDRQVDCRGVVKRRDHQKQMQISGAGG